MTVNLWQESTFSYFKMDIGKTYYYSSISHECIHQIHHTLNIAIGKNNLFLKLSSNVKVPMNSRNRYQFTIFSIYLVHDHCIMTAYDVSSLWIKPYLKIDSGFSANNIWYKRHLVRVTMKYLACKHLTSTLPSSVPHQLFHSSSARIRCRSSPAFYIVENWK